MRILVVSQFFYPETFRYNEIAAELANRGYKITVVTGIPNYPMGKFFPGYSWTKKRKETWNNIEINRIPLIARGQSNFGMILNYYSFVISGWFWNRFNKIDADMVLSFESSPMTQLKVGCGYARKHKVPHFVYVQDLWPENVEEVTGIHNRLVIGPIDRMVDKIYKQVDKIFVTTPSFVEAIVNRKKPVDRNKVHYWPQFAEEFYKPMNRSQVDGIPDDDSFKIAFTGNIGFAQGLEILPKTARILNDQNVRFVIVGDGRYQAGFEKLIDELGVSDKFILLPRVPAQKIPEILSACDAGFISFAKSPLWEMSIPAKLQSYMACGKAIIASASGETKRLINEANCGICCELGNAEELAEGIKTLMNADIDTMGKSARDYFDKNFSKSVLMDEFERYIREVERHKN